MKYNTFTLTPRESFFKRNLTWLPLVFGVLLLMLLAGPAAAAPLPSFSDPNLQACFDEQAAAQGWVNAEDVRELVCVERGIRDFYGVEQLPLLESLDLSGNLIEDLFPLNLGSGVSLPNLVSLRLGGNRILDVTPLQGYTNLQTLWLSGNAGIDFAQLQPIIEQNPNLTRLGVGDINLQEPGLPWFNINTAAMVELDVSNTGIEGLWGIEGYTALQVLDASDNRISDIYPLGMAPLSDNLRELRLTNNRIVDVVPLANYRNLQTLWLSGNSGIDFGQLQPIIDQNPNITRLGVGDINVQWLPGNHAAMIELDVSNADIKDLWGIDMYTSLQVLDASDNRIVDLYPLSMGPLSDSLRELRLANNAITDVSALTNYRNLQTLWLSGNAGIDFGQLQPIIDQNPNITRLGVGDINVQWLPGNHAAMIELDVSNAGIKDLWGIDMYTSLQVLDASDNRIVDLYPLSMGPLSDSLRELHLANNAITDVSALVNFRNLQTLWLSGNSGIDFGQLQPIIDQNPNITRLGVGDINVQWLPGNHAAMIELDVSNADIKDLWGIDMYTSLQVLDASDNRIVDLYPLSMGPLSDSLRELRLANNAITDVSALTNYRNLQTLWLSGNAGIDFGQLQPIIDQNPNITRLGVGDINVQWLPGNHAAMIELDVSNAGIKDLWGIDMYTSLQVLDASDNRIVDLYPLSMGPLSDSLRELHLANNAITDVSALVNFRNLQTLWLSGNSGIDFGQLQPIIDQNPNITRLGVGDINVQWLPGNHAAMIELDVSNADIKDLWGIDMYTSLQVLDASDNRIVDLYPLSMGPLSDSLRELRLANNAITDVSALTNYRNLQTLWLSGNAGIDFGQLQPIIDQNPNITRLGVGDINVQWLPGNHAAMIELDVSNAGIKDLWGIDMYTSLQVLDASDNRIVDLYPLSMGPLSDSLRELHLANNAITDVSALVNFRNLQTLWLSGNSGIDFGQLQPIIDQNPNITRLGVGDINVQWLPGNHAAMIELDVSNTGIEGLWGIEEYTSLQLLDASDNRIVDLYPMSIGPLSDSLRELRLANNAITDVSALTNFRNLQTLWLSGNAGIDFLQLRPTLEQNPNITRLGLGDINLPNLGLYINTAEVVELDVSNTGIEGLWGIENYISLQLLDASDNRIVDIYPLSMTPSFNSLRELRLANNRIVDVAPLQGYTGLQTLWLSGNAGIDFLQLRPILEQNPNITRLGLGDINLPNLGLYINTAEVVELDVSNTGIEGLWGIENYISLQLLDASDNRIVDLYPMSMGPLSDSLRELRLANNAITDVSALTNYRNLQTLWLSGNAGIDFAQLQPIIDQNMGLTRLGLGDINLQGPGLPFNINRAAVIELDVSNTGIEFLWGIEEYTSLQVLDASDNRIFDIYPLFNLLALELVDLRGNTGIPCDQLDQLEQILGSDVVLRPATCVVGQAPNLSIDQPVDGLIVIEGQLVILSANAFDTEDGDIGASIQWSSDLHGVLGIGAFLEIPLLPGDQILFATVTDSDGNTVSHSVNVSVLLNNAPSVEIYSPPNGISIVEGDQLVLDGYAYDTEDGDLTTALQWSSNIDGTLGSGSGVIVTLTPGEHTLTASATDQWGKTTEVTSVVTVVAFEGLQCDIDLDRDVDIYDILAIWFARNQPAVPGDARDADSDGVITILDARQCVVQCTNSGCAS